MICETKQQKEGARLIVTYTGSSGLRSRIFGFELHNFIAFIIIAALGLFVALLRYSQVSNALSLEWDSALFLTDGATYAGLSSYIQGYDPTKPPVVPFLLSIIFRITGPNQIYAYALSVSLYFIGIVGCFFLARRLIGTLLAVFAAASFAANPLVFDWSGIVLANVESTCIAAIALSFFYAAFEDNRPRLLLAAVPLIVLASFTQFSQGSIVAAAATYLLASERKQSIFDSYSFYYGCGIAFIVFLIFGGKWISYPILHHTTIATIFPRLESSGPTTLESGSLYFSTFPQQLGNGLYGSVLALLFLLSLFIIFGTLISKIRSKKKDEQKGYPIALSLAVWVGILVAYFVFLWPSKDIRYSVEYSMPAIILAFWPVSFVTSKLERIMKSGHRSMKIVCASSLVLLVFVLSYLGLVSALSTIEHSYVPETQINIGMREAASWLVSHVPHSSKLQSNWYTLMWWYATEYNTTAAPLTFPIQESNLAAWRTSLLKNGIDYVVYVESPSLSNGTSFLKAIWSSSNGYVTIYKVVS